MHTFKRIFLVALIVMTPQVALSASWKIDPAHTAVEFKVRHLMVSWVKGVFTNVAGTVEINESDMSASNVKIQIETASINTNNSKRDDHLRSPDFFDVSTYPMMVFVSKKVVAADNIPVKIIGDLTIRDVTKEVELDVEEFSGTVKDPWGNTRRGATAETEINRKDFGLTWNKALEAGGVVVGDEVRISLEVEMIQK